MREKVSREPDASFQVIFWLWRLCQGHHDSVVHVYQGLYFSLCIWYGNLSQDNFVPVHILISMRLLAALLFSALYFFILSLSSNFFATLSVSVLYLQYVGWLIREWSLQWNWWSVPLKILYIFFVLIYYEIYDFHIFSPLLLSFQTHCTLMDSSL